THPCANISKDLANLLEIKSQDMDILIEILEHNQWKSANDLDTSDIQWLAQVFDMLGSKRSWSEYTNKIARIKFLPLEDGSLYTPIRDAKRFDGVYIQNAATLELPPSA